MHEEVLRFWFDESGPEKWFAKDAAFDRLVTRRFAKIHARARRCELHGWRAVPAGRLAEIIVLDQFSRNMFRGTPEAFAHDALALALAQEAIAAGADQGMSAEQRNFLYMPSMHSESPAIHDIALALFERNGDRRTLDFERRHREIILQFGRYPHRNSILGRRSTRAELAFLEQPDSSF